MLWPLFNIVFKCFVMKGKKDQKNKERETLLLWEYKRIMIINDQWYLKNISNNK